MIERSLPPQTELGAAPAPGALRSTFGYALLATAMIVFQITIFIPAVLLDCGVRYGRRAMWTVLAIAGGFAAIAAAGAMRSPDTRLAGAYLVAVVLSHALPAAIVLPMVLRRESYGKVVAALLLLATAGLLATELGTRAVAGVSPYALQVAQAQETTAPILEMYRKGGMPPEAMRFFERWVPYWSTTLMPGGFLITTAVSFLLSLLMLGRITAWRARREGREDSPWRFRDFAVPEWVLFAFVLGGLTPLTHGLLQAVSANVLTVAVFLFITQGFALFRFMLAAMGIGFVGALIGMALLFLSGVGLPLLGIAGLFDPFFDFRHPKKRKDDSHESHSD